MSPNHIAAVRVFYDTRQCTTGGLLMAVQVVACAHPEATDSEPSGMAGVDSFPRASPAGAVAFPLRT